MMGANCVGNKMSQRSGAPRSSERSRSLYRFVDMVREREESEETEPTMDSEQPSQREEEEVESEPMEDPSNGDEARSVASSRMMRRSPPPTSAPRAPTPRQNAATNANDGGVPTHDPYIHPRPPHHYPNQFGPRHGEVFPRSVYGIPPPPHLGMTREERDHMWGIDSGLRDARTRVRSQEIMMERAFGIMRQSREEAGMALDEVHRMYGIILVGGCALAALCALMVVFMFKK